MKFFQKAITSAQIGAASALTFLVKYANAQTPAPSSAPARDSNNDIAIGVLLGVSMLACCAYYCCRNQPAELDDESRTIQAFARMRASDPNP